MNIMQLSNYSEPKPKRLIRIVWRVINAIAYPLLDRYSRIALLRLFGARIGKECLFYRTVKIYAPWNLSVGDMVCVGPRVDLFSKDRIVIGSGVVVSQDSYLCTGSHDITSAHMTATTAPISIGDNCWIAAKATILPGVMIGEGVVVGACAVVAKDVPSWSVLVGNPARVVGGRAMKGSV